MRFQSLAAIMLILAGCAPAVPDSGAGVGFDNYDRARLDREAQLTGQARPAPAATSADASATAPASEPATSDTASAATTGDPAAPRPAGISDEQNFAAVTGRETIESDRQRLEQQAAQYVVIEPKPLPQRTAAKAPSVVEFALGTSNKLGEPLYPRSSFLAQRRYERNCARYTSPERAQEDFLRMGGPQKDRRGLDPDGDGFACAWDPAPFRKAVR